MKYEIALAALVGVSAARELNSVGLTKREVPQEHAHEAELRAVNVLLQLNNPLKIQDAVFALLGNKAAAQGAPNVQNLDCLQQIVADQAFTNAKAKADVAGQATALIFRALERNTGSVGLSSVLCNETATNPEIAAITQHQDPAGPDAAKNKDIELALAKQLAAIGADPQLALSSATFPAGQLGDATGKGKTCDDANDAKGCINTLGLLTPLASAAEITAAVAGVAKGGNANAGNAGNANAGNANAGNANAGNATAGAGAACNAAAGSAAAPAAGSAAGASGSANDNAAASGTNVQAFSGTLGGVAPPVVSSASERPFSVNGATFLNIGAAIQRSCDVQHNACANAANSGQLAGGIGQCETQQKDCVAANQAKRRRQNEFGSCGSPAIKFAAGLDGRKENSFAAVDQGDFPHGSALNIKVIAEFNCDQLTNKCKASPDIVSKCDDAASAASSLKGQAAADAFNNALGV